MHFQDFYIKKSHAGFCHHNISLNPYDLQHK